MYEYRKYNRIGIFTIIRPAVYDNNNLTCFKLVIAKNNKRSQQYEHW